MVPIPMLLFNAISPKEFPGPSVGSKTFLPAYGVLKRHSLVLLAASLTALFIIPGFGCDPAGDESLTQYPHPNAMVRIVKLELTQQGVGGAKRPLLQLEVQNLADTPASLRLNPREDDLNVDEEVVQQRRKAGAGGTYVVETQVRFGDDSTWGPILHDGWLSTDQVPEDRQHLPGEAHLAAGCTRVFHRFAEASANCSWRVYIRDPAGGRIDARDLNL